MIRKDERNLRRICRNYHLVENYMQARFDEERWELHHRREIDEMKSMQQLKDEGRYFDVEPQELIFLTREEHNKLHHTDKHHSASAKKKMSDSMKGNQNMLGKHLSEETKKKISDAAKLRTGERHPQFGMHWWNDGKVSIKSKDCPGEGFVRGRLRV